MPFLDCLNWSTEVVEGSCSFSTLYFCGEILATNSCIALEITDRLKLHYGLPRFMKGLRHSKVLSQQATIEKDAYSYISEHAITRISGEDFYNELKTTDDKTS